MNRPVAALDDERLADRCREGRRAAWEEALHRHADVLWGVARRHLDAPAAADEAVIAAVRAARTAPPQGRDSRTMLLSALATRLPRATAGEESLPPVPTPPVAPLGPDDLPAVRAAWTGLPDRVRLVLALHGVAGLGVPAAAGVLGESQDLVRDLLYRGKEALRRAAREVPA